MLCQKKIKYFSSFTILLLTSSELQAQVIAWGLANTQPIPISFTAMVVVAMLLMIFGQRVIKSSEKSSLMLTLVGTALIAGMGISMDKVIANGITTITITTATGSENLVVNGNTRVTNDYSSAIEITGITPHGCTISANTCTVGAVLNPTDSCEITTSACPDTTPDAFTFTDVVNATVNTQYTSNQITVASINSNAVIAVTGGDYNINGGAYTNTAGTVSNGQNITVRQTSSANYATQTDTVLTIGGVSDTYSVTTIANTAPTATDATTSAGAGETAIHDLAPNIADAETPDNGLIINVITPPTKDSLSWVGTQFTFTATPASGVGGADTFTYNVQDPGGLTSATRTVTINDIAEDFIP